MQANKNFIQIPNEVFDNFRKCRLSTIQWQLVMMVLRYTYGYNRDSCELPLSFIQSDILVNKRSIQRELQMLMKSRILIEKQAPSSTKSRVFAFNTNFSEWTILTPDKMTTSSGDKIAASRDVKSNTSRDVKTTTQENTYIKTNNKNNYNPPKSPQGESSLREELPFEKKMQIKQSEMNMLDTPDKPNKPDTADVIENAHISSELKSKLREWIAYKKERGESYKPMGLSSLVSQVEKTSEKYGNSEVIELISTCMSNGYKGIIFDRLGNQGGSWKKELPKSKQIQTYHTFEEAFGYDY